MRESKRWDIDSAKELMVTFATIHENSSVAGLPT
jgi:hypothetical protein